jgi:hypothetical protein
MHTDTDTDTHTDTHRHTHLAARTTHKECPAPGSARSCIIKTTTAVPESHKTPQITLCCPTSAWRPLVQLAEQTSLPSAVSRMVMWSGHATRNWCSGRVCVGQSDDEDGDETAHNLAPVLAANAVCVEGRIGACLFVSRWARAIAERSGNAEASWTSSHAHDEPSVSFCRVERLLCCKPVPSADSTRQGRRSWLHTVSVSSTSAGRRARCCEPGSKVGHDAHRRATRVLSDVMQPRCRDEMSERVIHTLTDTQTQNTNTDTCTHIHTAVTTRMLLSSFVSCIEIIGP